MRHIFFFALPLYLNFSAWIAEAFTGRIKSFSKCGGIGSPCGLGPPPSGKTRNATNRRRYQMVGDFFSGITGLAPASLIIPTDELLRGTSLDPAKDNVDLQCVYKASRDGWSAVDFHRCCDRRGSGLVVALSQSGKKFGGFNPLGWQSTDDYGSTNSAFLWYSKGTGAVELCPVISGGNAAVFDYATGGPQFGSADLIIGPPQASVMGGFAGPNMEDTAVNAGSLRQGRSSIGGAYELVGRWPMGGSFKLVEVEVYCNANIAPQDNTGGGFGFSWPF